MVSFEVREGESGAFTYSFNGYSPEISVVFVAGSAGAGDGYGGTRTATSITSINGYIYGAYTYSYGAYADTVDESPEVFYLQVYYNGVLDETVEITVLDDAAWHGTATRDAWSGGESRDVYFGYAGADEIRGRTGNDDLDGGDGGDKIYGGKGDDTLIGGKGRDVLSGDGGSDTVHGNSGDDLIYGKNGDDHLYGGSHHDTLMGGNGQDTLSGGTGNDTLYGGSKDDLLLGGGGSDIIEGGFGRDTIDGGAHDDILSGGGGADIFVFVGSFGHDTITDFSPPGTEKIDLSDIAEIAGFRKLMRHHASEEDNAVLLDLGTNGSITLEGLELADLSARDFLFA